MAKNLDPHEASAAREDARRLEAEADTGEPYPDGTVISRPNQASRMFNVRLSEEQFAAIQEIREPAPADVHDGPSVAPGPTRQGTPRVLTSAAGHLVRRRCASHGVRGETWYVRTRLHICASVRTDRASEPPREVR